MSEDLSGLDLVGLLDRLVPVPEPPPISLWPQTEGWIWLAVLLLVLGIALAQRWLRHRRDNAYRRAALAAIASAGDDAVALAAILRRTALAAYPRAQVAALQGDAWLAFLDQAYGGTGFSEGPGRAVARAPYQRPSRSDTSSDAGLAALVRTWVQRHRPLTTTDDGA